jgi:hypothetical protein
MATGFHALLVYPATFVGVSIVVWLLFSLIWHLGGRVGRATGASAKVDQFLDTDGAHLPDGERIKDDGGFRGGIGGP